MSAPQRRPAPWEPDDLVRLVAGTLVGVAVLGAAWYGASGEGRLSRQVSWLNLSVVGLMLAGAANLMWLARGRRSVGERRRALLLHWERPSGAPAGPLSVVTIDASERALVRAPDMRFAHRAGCPLLAGKRTVPAPDGDPRCRICAES